MAVTPDPTLNLLQVREAAKRKENARLAYEKWLETAESNYRHRGYMYCEQPEPSFCNSSNRIGPCDDSSDDITSQSSSMTRSHTHCANNTPQCQFSVTDQHLCVKLRTSHNYHYH